MSRFLYILKSFKMKLFAISFLIMAALAFSSTIIMYLMGKRALMEQAASITETNMDQEIEILNTVFYNMEYCSELLASSEELIELCSDEKQWDYQKTAEKYRYVKSMIGEYEYATGLEGGDLADSKITFVLYLCGQTMVFDMKSTFYEKVQWENVPFLQGYEEKNGRWTSSVRVNGVNLYQSNSSSKYQETVISRCFPINDESGELLGVLAAQVSSSVFENYFSDTQKGLSGETIVIDEMEAPVLYSDSELYSAFSRTQTDELEMKSGWKTLWLNATEYMLIKGDVENINAQIFIFIPMAVIRLNISMLTKILLLDCMIVLVISLCATILIFRYFYHPIGILKENMYLVREGNLTVKIAAKRNDEFQDIFDTFNNMTYRLESLLQKVTEERLLNERAELRLLQEQLNPHFLYNTLDSVYSIAKINKQDQIAEITAAMSRFFRISLSGGKDMVFMKAAVDIARNYLIIQKIKFGDRIQYSINVEDGLSEIQVPKLIVQPLVENSIYHGIEKKRGGGSIVIHVSFQEGMCCLVVKDDGMGMEEEKLEALRACLYSEEESGYYALRNLARQLRILYKGEERFTLDSKYGEGMRVEIMIPVVRLKEGNS